MQIWYLPPFLLAALVYWVQTRKHPEDKEKWTWCALGICLGAALMFILVFVSRQATPTSPSLANAKSDVERSRPMASLGEDTFVEVLPPTRLQENRGIGIGSLQITLLQVTEAAATLRLEPAEEVFVIVRSQVSLRQIDTQANVPPPATKGTPPPTKIVLGGYMEFIFRNRSYRLGLLETELPLWGLAPRGLRGILPPKAVVRLLEGKERGFTIDGAPSGLAR
ncbi:MAG: hypothetical protein JW395_3131 [Nitrospira sp.]|nr:hypothetical protein [Nitrospira sp.]